jgi:hypothetical protein
MSLSDSSVHIMPPDRCSGFLPMHTLCHRAKRDSTLNRLRWRCSLSGSFRRRSTTPSNLDHDSPALCCRDEQQRIGKLRWSNSGKFRLNVAPARHLRKNVVGSVLHSRRRDVQLPYSPHDGRSQKEAVLDLKCCGIHQFGSHFFFPFSFRLEPGRIGARTRRNLLSQQDTP